MHLKHLRGEFAPHDLYAERYHPPRQTESVYLGTYCTNEEKILLLAEWCTYLESDDGDWNIVSYKQESY
jgi:hypothetical protein